MENAEESWRRDGSKVGLSDQLESARARVERSDAHAEWCSGITHHDFTSVTL